MKGPPRRPAPCPRCGEPIAGDFKFCPTCACRLRTDAIDAPDAPPVANRWPNVVMGVLLGAIVVATAVVGFRLFRDSPGPDPVGDEPARNPIRGVLGVHDIRRLMVNLPPGDAMVWPHPEDPTREVPVVVDYFSMVLPVEVTEGMYAEFVRSCEADRSRLPSFLEELWRPPRTGDPVQDTPRLQYAEEYLDRWWDRAAAHLEERFGRAFERPEDLQVPVPEHYGVLLLVPPRWLYVTGFEDLAWEVPDVAENFPVTEVSWYDAVGFARWASAELGIPELRLLLYAEWIRAGNGGDPTRRFPWGEKAYRYACNSINYWREDETPRALPVSWVYYDADGRTREGLFGMSGNVREWTHGNEFAFSGDRYRIVARPGLEEERARAPTMGGSFREGVEDCTVDIESSEALEKLGRWDHVGFRLWMPGTFMD